MIIDENMNWNEHAKYIIGRASKLMNILKVLRGTWWGDHPQTLLQIYVALIRAIIEYSLYLIHITDTSLRTKLQKIQNQCIRLALGYRMSTPINVLHAESKIPYLDNRLQKLADNFTLKLLFQTSSPLLHRISTLNSNLASYRQVSL